MALDSGSVRSKNKSPKERAESKKNAIIAALLKERRGYKINGRTADVEAVDAELKLLGVDAKPPAKRATKLDKKKPDAEL